MSWSHLTPKQLVSISSRRIDLIPPAHYFQLSVFNPNLKIAMRMPRKWKMSKKKCLQMNQQQGRTLQNIKTDHFRQLFNPKSSSGTLPKASDQQKKNYFWLNFFWKICENFIFSGRSLLRWNSKVEKYVLKYPFDFDIIPGHRSNNTVQIKISKLKIPYFQKRYLLKLNMSF